MGIIIPEIISISAIGVAFVLLVKGRFAISAHLTLILLLSAIWLLLFSGEDSLISWLDTTILCPGLSLYGPVDCLPQKNKASSFTQG